MRQIKFRGIDAETGGTVYGYPVIYDSGKFTHWFYRPNEDSNCPVKPESIAQLVGYDSNGVEVYEGDTLIDAFDNQYEVQFYPMGVNEDDCINLADSAKLNLTLKENHHEDSCN